MKMQKVLALCKQRKQAMIFELNDVQWVNTGAGYYKLENMPLIKNENEYCTLAGIERDKALVRMGEAPTLIEFNDYTADDAMARELEVELCIEDSKLHGFQTNEDVIVVQGEYLSMFNGNDLVFQLRKIETLTGKTIRYISVLEGFVLKACILETRLRPSPAIESVVGDAKTLYEELKKQIGERERGME